MASYYYLISSLPDLKTDGDMPLTYDEFLGMCQTSVSEKKYNILENLTLHSEEGPILKEWSAFYGNLTKELNYQRSMKLGQSYSAPEDKDFSITQVAQAALAAKNPLEAEKILLECEFENLDSLVGLHAFDDNYLFGYAIKLKLLERQNCFVHEKGQKEFKRLFDQVQQRVYSL